MKSVIGEQALALASGVSPENIESYASTVDHILVASSIETRPYSGILVEERLAALIDLVRSDATAS